MLRSLPGYSAPCPGEQTVRRRRRARLGAVVATSLLVACAGSPRPCRSPSACSEGNECLANRCLPLGAEPVAADTQRIVLDPVALAVVRAGASFESALPPTVTFGGPPHQSEQLLVAFAADWGAGVDIDTAFLLLAPALDAEPSAGDVELGVAVAAGDWRSGTSGELPASQGPTAAGVGRTRPPAALRIDVTALIRKIAKQPRSTHGLVVRGTRASERGAVYATGIEGRAPRLDVYFRQRSKPR